MPGSDGLVSLEDVPDIDLDTGALEDAASRLRAKAESFGEHAQAMNHKWQALPEVFSSPGVLEPLYSGMGTVCAVAEEVNGYWNQTGNILLDFASYTSTLQNRRKNLVEAITEFLHHVARVQDDFMASPLPGSGGHTTPGSWKDYPSLVTQNEQLCDQAHQLTTAWEQLRTDTVIDLGGVKQGLSAMRYPSKATLVPDVMVNSITVAGITGTSAAKLGKYSPDQLLGLLKNIPAARLRMLFAADPGLVQDYWSFPPDSAQVASWWAGLSPQEQASLAAAIPTVLGNLGGIPYGTRSSINLAEYQKDKANYKNLTQEQQRVVDQLTKALGTPGGAPGLVDYNMGADNGHRPYMGLSYGDLDTAQQVSWDVPGMASNAAAGLSGWAQVARNLYNQEKVIAPSKSIAVVAWLGYDTPSWETVSSSDAAMNGAPRLAAELDAVHDTRLMGGSNAVPQLSVVAHSYGTTTAAFALTATKNNVSSFVMVASAGIDDTAFIVHDNKLEQLTSFTDLNVGSVTVPGQGKVQAVYTTAASADGLAPFDASVSGRAEPNPSVAEPLDPVIPGAESFSSDGDAAHGLTYTDGHGALGAQVPWYNSFALNANPSPGHGYFDKNTQSLHNVAAAALGMPDKVDGGLSNTDSYASW